MSNSTPPGWYPVPGTGPDGAATHERWWDGTAWSSDVRPAAGGPPAGGQIADAPTQAWQSAAPDAPQPAPGWGAPAAPPGYGPAAQPGQGYGYPPQPGPGYQAGYPAGGAQPGGPGLPGYPPGTGYPGPATPRRSGNGLVIGVVVAVLVAGGIAAGVALNSGDDPKPRPTPTFALPTLPDGPSESATSSPSRRPSPSASPRSTAPVAVTGTVPDAQHAITVPVLTGWVAGTPGSTATVSLTSGPYTCPGGGDCVRGQFSIKTDPVEGSTARAAAEAAIPAYAQAIFSGLSSHTDAGSAATTVAGVAGYAVRWHVRTSDGTTGYVLLAAVPAEGGGFVVLNGGVDEDPKAPDPSALDQILKGIKQDGTGSGV
ncbi:DUF2510 domain-containing protein [Kitasatospora sp. NBC_00240]|uniref:DUF2510 domain-containing protein n=1 Tax=Kitasatospora sp. NBC_00240 TaxID=2903567 RepID=UPI0022555CF2|nr:DUF2510 domain-containing protein [Kitasatospora sp. NBC_00240]MCX5213350.1 DUF2510 domain-containing protein [Kitasatospora sp. NBC_00240]